jgi:hypothetical protein
MSIPLNDSGSYYSILPEHLHEYQPLSIAARKTNSLQNCIASVSFKNSLPYIACEYTFAGSFSENGNGPSAVPLVLIINDQGT